MNYGSSKVFGWRLKLACLWRVDAVRRWVVAFARAMHTLTQRPNQRTISERGSERLPRTAAPSPRGVIITAVAADATRALATYAAISESA